jgi:tetratricopeptide (TPR) repeat protein
LLDRAEAVAPDNPSILLSRAIVHGRRRSYEKALALLDRLAEKSGEAGLGANEWLEKGRLLDQMGRHDEAFEAWVEGKRRCRERGSLVYRDEPAQQLIDRLRAFFTETRMRVLPRASVRDDVAQPIFIVGFPRSGTTLVEQTLSVHPRISAGDELPFINEIADAMVRTLNSPIGYPEALAELWMGDRRHGRSTSCATVTWSRCAASTSSNQAPRGSPTRCRSTKRISVSSRCSSRAHRLFMWCGIRSTSCCRYSRTI